MFINLSLGLSVMSVCLIVQSLLVLQALRFYKRNEAKHQDLSLLSDMLRLVVVMLILVLGNFGQVFVWATLFWLLGEFSAFQDAVYHSAVNFATLGYGDIVMSEKHKLLGPLEAINGVLMIGVSTAALMTTFQHTLKRLSERFD